MDIITDVYFEGNKLMITVSDGSLIQIGLTDKSISKIREEVDLLIGAEVISVYNNTREKIWQMDYKSKLGRERTIALMYK